MEYSGCVIGIHHGRRVRRYVALSFLSPVYAKIKSRHRVDPQFQFLKCRRKLGVAKPVVETLHDTHELSPAAFNSLSRYFDLEDVSRHASANDCAAVLYRRPDYGAVK